MAVRLHRCSDLEARADEHPCWRVQQELELAGIEFVVVPGPTSRGHRDGLARLSGQEHYPVIEFEDGRVYREDSADMAARIADGCLTEIGLTSPYALDAAAPAAPVPDR